MADLTQASQAGLPSLTQDQIANTVSLQKISDKRKRNEMMRAGTSDPSAFAVSNAPQIQQTIAQPEYLGAGRKLASNQNPDMTAVSFLGNLPKVDNQYYYYGDNDISTAQWGTNGYQTQDTDPGKYNILGKDGTVLGTGYKDVHSTLADYIYKGISKDIQYIPDSTTTEFDTTGRFWNRKGINPHEVTTPGYWTSSRLTTLGEGGEDMPTHYNSQAEVEQALHELANQRVPDYGGPLGDWEALGRVITGQYTPVGNGRTTLRDFLSGRINRHNTSFGTLPNPNNWGGFPSSGQDELISGLNTLYGSTPLMLGNKVQGYKFDITPGTPYAAYESEGSNIGGEMYQSATHDGKNHSWSNSVWRDPVHGDWSMVNPIDNQGNVFVNANDASKIPGWYDKDSYNRVQHPRGVVQQFYEDWDVGRKLDPVLRNTDWKDFAPIGQTVGDILGTYFLGTPIGSLVMTADNVDKGDDKAATASAISAAAQYAGGKFGTNGSSGVFGSGTSLGSAVANKAAERFLIQSAANAALNGGNIKGALAAAAMSTASGAGGDALSSSLNPELGAIASKAIGGAAAGGLNSLFNKGDAVKGSLYGAMSGGLHGYLNSNTSNTTNPPKQQSPSLDKTLFKDTNLRTS